MSFTRAAGLGCLLLLSPALCFSAYADDEVDFRLIEGTVDNGTLTVSGKSSAEAVTEPPDGNEKYGNIYGAVAQAGSLSDRADNIHTTVASGNNITFNGFLKTYYLIGAISEPTMYDSTGNTSSTADNNTIKISDGDNSVSFGAAAFIGLNENYDTVAGVSDYSVTLSASHNSFDITGGSQKNAVGGIATIGDGIENATITSAVADDNTLTLYGGTYTLESIEGDGDTGDIFDYIGIAAGAVFVLPGDNVKLGTISASNNKLVLAAGSDGKSPEFIGDIVLRGSMVFGDTTGCSSLDTTRNTLVTDNVKGMTAYNVENFSTYEFRLPDMKANETVLTLTDPDGTALKGGTLTSGNSTTEDTVSVKVTRVGNLYGADGQSEFKAGDKVYLLKNEKGLTITEGYTTSLTGQTGVSLNYEMEIGKDENSLYLVRTGGTSVNSGTKAIAEGAAAGSALINAGSDAVISAISSMNSASRDASGKDNANGRGQARDDGNTYGNIFAFGYAQGSSVRHETGSSVNVSAVSLVAGLGKGFETGAGKLAVGAFFEYGKGSYTTNNSFDDRSDIDGDGNAWYMGGGIMARMDFVPTGPGRFYVEGSAHMGTLHNEYDSNDLTDTNGRVAKFDMDSPYYTLHGGLGYVWNFAEGHDLDIYGKYIWSRVQGTDDSLTTKDKFEYDDMDSNRIRLGVRYSYAGNARFSPYIGAAFEHEFSGSCDSRAYGHPVAAPSFEGSSGMGELGLVMKPSASVPLSLNLGVQG